MAGSAVIVDSDVRTPPGGGGLLAGRWLPEVAARLGARIAALRSKPLRLGRTFIVARHAQVTEVFARDLDFRIAPINEASMAAVNGAFVLGMDRGARLEHERRALYAALARTDLAALARSVAHAAAERVAAAGDGLDVVAQYARPIAAATARRLFGVQAPPDDVFMDAVRAIFGHTFLNVGNDKAIAARALRAAGLMRGWLADEIARRRGSGELGDDMMGGLLGGGLLDDDGVRRTLGGMLVGSIDTTATSVAKIVAVIARDPRLLVRIRADLDDAARMAGWCHEALRRWPHNPVVLRATVAATTLGGAPVPAGARVFAWTQAAMHDTSAFPRPAEMRADRPPAAYLHYGGGLHPCAGRAVNAFQIPLLVGALVRRGIGRVGPIRWAGPFPDHLPLAFASPAR